MKYKVQITSLKWQDIDGLPHFATKEDAEKWIKEHRIHETKVLYLGEIKCVVEYDYRVAEVEE